MLQLLTCLELLQPWATTTTTGGLTWWWCSKRTTQCCMTGSRNGERSRRQLDAWMQLMEGNADRTLSLLGHSTSALITQAHMMVQRDATQQCWRHAPS